MRQRRLIFLTFLLLIIIPTLILITNHQEDPEIDKKNLELNVVNQLSFGPRYPGSEGHIEIKSWIEDKLILNNWIVEKQNFNYHDVALTNIIAKHGNTPPWIILATHYDTRKYADKDPIPSNRQLPVPGANDGASGTALLLELARILPDETNITIWLVFLDAEDQGNIDQWEWSVGANHFVEQLKNIPDYVVVPDMIANPELQIIQERYSNEELFSSLENIAQNIDLGFIFSEQPGIYVIDDHLPFIKSGITSVLLIDLSYPHWHTVMDTIENIDFESIKSIGTLLLAWINTLNPINH